MKINISKTLCTIGIIVLLVVLLYATYIKNTYTPKTDNLNQNVNINQDNNMTNEDNNIQNSEQDNNEEEIVTPEIRTLNCYSVYYDEEDTKANIKEEIIVTYENDKATKQEHKFNYSFEKVIDYNNLKTKFDSIEQQNNIQTNYDQTTNAIERIMSSDYSMEALPNDSMDFRNHKLEDAKTYLKEQQFICN